MKERNTMEEYRVINPTPAPRGKRFLNLILDIVGEVIFMVSLGLFVAITRAGKDLSEDSWGIIVILCVMMYYIIPELIWGKTPGKFITRTKVVTRNGGKPSIVSIVVRTLCRWNPLDPFFFLGSPHPVGWHDRISRTMVVDASKKFTPNLPNRDNISL